MSEGDFSPSFYLKLAGSCGSSGGRGPAVIKRHNRRTDAGRRNYNLGKSHELRHLVANASDRRGVRSVVDSLLCELCLYAADLCVESLINISDLGVCIDVRLKKLVASLKLGDPGCLACLVSVHEMILVANRNCACSTENIAEISAERTKRGADDAESKAGIRLSVYVSIIFMFKSHNFFSFFFLFVLFFVFIYL